VVLVFAAGLAVMRSSIHREFRQCWLRELEAETIDADVRDYCAEQAFGIAWDKGGVRLGIGLMFADYAVDLAWSENRSIDIEIK
jgi:hypothetical protein